MIKLKPLFQFSPLIIGALFESSNVGADIGVGQVGSWLRRSRASECPDSPKPDCGEMADRRERNSAKSLALN